MMAKWLAMASIIGPIKRNRKYGIPMERNFDGEKIRLQHRMYTSTHARTHEIKLVGCQAENRNSKRRIRFQHECVYDYFMMIIFWTTIFTMFHFHAEQFDAGHFQLALNCCRRCCHRIELKNSMFIFHFSFGFGHNVYKFSFQLFNVCSNY